jgi:hypothetical protein
MDMTHAQRGIAAASAMMNGSALVLAGLEAEACEHFRRAVDLFAGDLTFAADNLVDLDRLIDGLAHFSRVTERALPPFRGAVALKLRLIGEPV